VYGLLSEDDLIR